MIQLNRNNHLTSESSKGIAHRLDHMRKFLKRLGDPTDYRFNGGVGDAGPESLVKCACGMRIRYMFGISHKIDESRTAVVGCKCIKYFKDANPELFKELYSAYEKLLKDIRDKKKQEVILERQT